ncbi:MAG: hypothetical protein HYW25_02690 [Candidatus Aenigmarchaeota archaeon]|nr:hypothetical protein [Candidatus Aenigmarchaeota archaeon]
MGTEIRYIEQPIVPGLEGTLEHREHSISYRMIVVEQGDTVYNGEMAALVVSDRDAAFANAPGARRIEVEETVPWWRELAAYATNNGVPFSVLPSGRPGIVVD